MSEPDSRKAKDDEANPSPFPSTGQAKELIAPAHFFSQEVAARVYQDKQNKLRAGRPSGISKVFGGATVFFCPPADESAGWQLKLDQFQPVDDLDVQVRIERFVSELEALCRKFLAEHLSAWRSGAYDTGSKPGVRHPTTEKARAVVLKTSMIAFMLMITVDQQLEEPPAWFQEFMWGSMEKANCLTQTPEIKELLGVIWDGAGVDATNMCKNVTNRVCKELGFGVMGEPAWLAVFDFFSITRRTSVLEKALA
jgi:hypothetical protein